METRLYLMAAMLIVGCGCIGFLIVRISNPFLKGLGWLAATFACGVLSTAILSLDGHIPRFFPEILGNFLSDVVAYMFLNAAILELTGSKRRITWFSIALAALWLPGMMVFTFAHNSHQLRVEFGSVVFGLQVLQSAIILVRSQEKGVRVPCLFTATVLFAFSAFNFLRAGLTAVQGLPQDLFAPSPLQIVSIVVYLTAPLGFAFGLFWMSTAKLRLSFEQLASTDPLLGIANRRYFRSACEKELARYQRSGEAFSLLVADIDHFKRINDQHGHMVGDAVLVAVAKNLQTHLRPFDLLGRWGGEEFVVLLPACPLPVALQVAERLRSSIEEWSQPEITPSGTPIPITVSLGVATYLGVEPTLDDLFRRADKALYRAKSAGRNRVYTSDGPEGEQTSNNALQSLYGYHGT
jgi:diguanylate cyclase (GGDEF)-like protein